MADRQSPIANGAAPGHPGIAPRWTSSAKSGVGTVVPDGSRVWFTLSHGIVNEVYYPRLDQANTRDCGLVITDGHGFVSEEKRHATSEIRPLAQGVPGYRLTNRCVRGRYQIEKTVITDRHRDVLLQRVRFETLRGAITDYHVHVLLAPHIGNCGYGNSGWVGEYNGVTMLFAARDGTTLALACSTGFTGLSCGYVGVSDGWRDLSAHGRMTWFHDSAADGNIALTGEIDLAPVDATVVLALGFGRNAAEAGQQARAALLTDFDTIARDYVEGWQEFQRGCIDLGRLAESGFDLYRVSTAVLRTHEAMHLPGGMIASLSIPWGFEKGDEDLGGYHLVWPRDLVESAGGLLAAGDTAAARRALLYLMSTQQADGAWPQNMWLDGTPYWTGLQMDEVAFPILLADQLRRAGALEGVDVWSMVRPAAGFLVRNGPVTQQDRWEEDGGYSPFTLAVEVAALLAAADFARDAGDAPLAAFLTETADTWNDQIERWTYVSDTALAHQLGVDGYYVRIAAAETCDAASPLGGFVAIKNRPPDQTTAPVEQIVSTDALALVRFGLRAPDDPRIVDTVTVIDALLKTETATGPVWHRYNRDGYGEHDDGRPFDGMGRGRGWPLLAGERAHYELACGRNAEARRLLDVMTRQASPGGLLPEQIWDAADIPERELFNGHPSGSAMPLVWAHAEYIKLLRSLRDGRVFDVPPHPVARYRRDKVTSSLATWRFNQKTRSFARGRIVRIELLAPAKVHWSADGWRTVEDRATRDTGVGLHVVDLPTAQLPAGIEVAFTFFWPQANRWEGQDFSITVLDGQS
jgi:glucoamylase